MRHWIEELRNVIESGGDCAIVTIAGSRGSVPRDAGAKMIVTPSETIGTIGGGQLEYQCARSAFERLGQGRRAAATMRRFPLGSAMGQCCGGVVEVLTEPLSGLSPEFRRELLDLYDSREPFVVATSESAKALITVTDQYPRKTFSDFFVDQARRLLLQRHESAVAVRDTNSKVLLEPVIESAFHIAVFGAGHVGTAVVSMLAGIRCAVRWIDPRRHVFPKWACGNIVAIESSCPTEEVAAMPEQCFYLVTTHSHALDYDICAAILDRGDFAYCGLIGSKSKRRRFEKLMRQRGMPKTRVARLNCPIGLSGIAGKAPQEIAVGVVAEFLILRDAASAAHPAMTDVRLA